MATRPAARYLLLPASFTLLLLAGVVAYCCYALGTADGRHAVATAGAAFLLFAAARLEVGRIDLLLGLTATYLGLLLVEYFLLGWPQALAPDLLLSDPAAVPLERLSAGQAVVFWFNTTSPLLYFLVKIMVLLMLLRLFFVRDTESGGAAAGAV